MSQSIQTKKLINDSIVKDINDSIQGLKFGIVTIKVHNSKIVEIEIAEKKRFDDVWIDGGAGI